MGNSVTLQRGSERSEQTENEKQEEEPAAESEDQNSRLTCEICIEPMPMELSNHKLKNRNRNRCGAHPFCTDCMIKYIQVKIEDHVSNIKCPALNCDQFLDPLSCRPTIPRPLFDKWCDVLFDSAVLGLDRCYCPYRNCSVLVVNECGGTVMRSQCPNCKRLFCFQCKLPWHAGYRCEESSEMRDRNDRAFGVLVEMKKWMRCPQCHHVVELIEGCKIVKCRCSTSFCYKCGRKVSRHWCGCDEGSWFCLWIFRICTVLLLLFAISCLLSDIRRS